MRSAMSLFILAFAVPLLGQVNIPHSNLKAADPRFFTVVVEEVDSFLQLAAPDHLRILGLYRPAKIVVLEASKGITIEKIAQYPFVSYVSPTMAEPNPELPVPGHNLFVNKINAAHAAFPHFDGRGTVVSIKEFRFDPTDVDLKNRVLDSPDATQELTAHAAIMASLVGGAGNSDLQGKGAAPGCALVSTGFGLLLPEEDYGLQGVTVQNHAYGVGIENFYGGNAVAFDVSTAENPKLLHVFSAGNSGEISSETGPYTNVQGFANLTGNFKMAKNVLTVGAVDSLGDLAFFSSRGPAFDGRTKPDLVAFGNDGTSGAAALVSGAVAVLQQAFFVAHDSLPNSDLIRAVLTNSADDRGRAGPDFEYGFGNMNLNKAIQMVENQQFVAAEIAASQSWSFPISLPDNIHQLKITLAWNGVAAQAGTAKALVHDLDLEVLDPGGQTWLPWVLNAAPNADSLKLPAIRGRDTLNNVEQITIDQPPPGQYAIQVYGTRIPAGNQSFSIAYSYDTIGYFQWTYPLRNSPAVADEGALLAWESNVGNSSGQLEWKLVGEQNWRVIDTALALEKGLRRWVMPDTFAEAQVRMLLGSKIFQSDTFLISKELRLKIGFNCPDSLGLFWENVAESARYMVYGLGQYQLEPLFETRDTFVSLLKTEFPEQRFAVAAIGPNRAGISKRSAAPDIDNQGVFCYQKSFLASLNSEKQIDLSLELASLYGVAAVQFEKWNGAQFSAIKSFGTNGTAQFAYRDSFPGQGQNLYRALISTSNSGQVLSDTASVYFTGARDWLVFPNPVGENGVLKVLTEVDGTTEFRLFDPLGRRVLTQVLEGGPVEIPLNFLPKGFYFFEAMENGRRRWSGGLCIVN